MGAAIVAATLALWLMPTAVLAQAPDPSDTVVAPDAEDPLADLVEPADTVLLSDEQSTTRWAHAQQTTPIRSEPRASAS